MQVTLNSLYLELVDAAKNDKSELSLITWLQEKASSYDVCYYLFVLINFVMNILIFIQSMREGDFFLYVECLRDLCTMAHSSCI